MKDYLKHTCPVCHQKMFVANNRYQCENCSFHIPGFIGNRHISLADAENILSGERIILDGFTDSKGRAYSSAPLINFNTVSLHFEIYFCYREDNKYLNGLEFRGKVVVFKNHYKCLGGGKCKYCIFAKNKSLYRTYDGHEITPTEIVQLLETGKLTFKTYTEKGNIVMKTFNYPRSESIQNPYHTRQCFV